MEATPKQVLFRSEGIDQRTVGMTLSTSLFSMIVSSLDEEQPTWKDELLLVFEITGSCRMRTRQSVSAEVILDGVLVS